MGYRTERPSAVGSGTRTTFVLRLSTDPVGKPVVRRGRKARDLQPLPTQGRRGAKTARSPVDRRARFRRCPVKARLIIRASMALMVVASMALSLGATIRWW
jgi:hypothetical protein